MAVKHSGRRATNGDNDVVKVQSEIRDGIDKERLKRYAREYKQSVETEEALASLSRFKYEPIDYQSALTRKPFVEPAIPDYSYILTEARLKIANKYQTSIIIQLILGLFFVIFSLAFRDSFVPFIGAAGFIICTLTLHSDLQKRQREMSNALTSARTLIDNRIKEQRETIEDARKTFEEAEDARIDRINKLLTGDDAAVFERLQEVLHNTKLPFYMRCSVRYYESEATLTLSLPSHSIIPTSIVTLTSTGVCEYEEKSAPEITRQYNEVLAATAITLATVILSYLPSLSVLYILGMKDKWEEPECLFSLRIPHEAIFPSPEWPSGLDAFKILGARYDLETTNGVFSPVPPQLPDWWDRAPKEKVRDASVSCQPRL